MSDRWDMHDIITVLDNTTEALDAYGYRYGADFCSLSAEHLNALTAGKVLALNVNDEYVVFVMLASSEDIDRDLS